MKPEDIASARKRWFATKDGEASDYDVACCLEEDSLIADFVAEAREWLGENERLRREVEQLKLELPAVGSLVIPPDAMPGIVEERDRLRARVKVLGRALEPFAEQGGPDELAKDGDLFGYRVGYPVLTFAPFRRAAEALAAGEEP